MISALSFTGIKEVTTVRTDWLLEILSIECHMNPAVILLSSWSFVNRAASCSADAPDAENTSPVSDTSQKFLTERLL